MECKYYESLIIGFDEQLLLDDLDLLLGILLAVFLQIINDLLASAVLKYLFYHVRVLVELLEATVQLDDGLQGGTFERVVVVPQFIDQNMHEFRLNQHQNLLLIRLLYHTRDNREGILLNLAFTLI